MEPSELTRRAEELLTRAGLNPPFGAVTPPEAARMCEAFNGGVTVEAIAEGLERSVDTVRNTLKVFQPSMTAARQRLEGGALEAADRWAHLAATSKNHFAAKDLLQAVGVVESDGRRGGTQVQVIIGAPGHPAVDASTITVTKVNVATND